MSRRHRARRSHRAGKRVAIPLPENVSPGDEIELVVHKQKKAEPTPVPPAIEQSASDEHSVDEPDSNTAPETPQTEKETTPAPVQAEPPAKEKEESVPPPSQPPAGFKPFVTIAAPAIKRDAYETFIRNHLTAVNNGRASAPRDKRMKLANGNHLRFPIKYLAPKHVGTALRCWVDPGQKNYRGAPEQHSHVSIWHKGDGVESAFYCGEGVRWLLELDLTTHGAWDNKSRSCIAQAHPGTYGKAWASSNRQPPVGLYIRNGGKWMLHLRGSTERTPTHFESELEVEVCPHVPGRQHLLFEFMLGSRGYAKATVNGKSAEIRNKPSGINASGLGNKNACFVSWGFYGKPRSKPEFVDVRKAQMGKA